nr:synergin gamma-like [Procambarus clarkii]
MPNSGKGQGGGAWVPGITMPPLGFGVVPQQPGGMMAMSAPVGGQQVVPQGSHMPNWHQQQFMPAKSIAVSSTVGVQPLTQQQQHFNQQVQYQHHLQQQQHLHQQHYQHQHQWVEAQKKAVEEQKKLFGQMMKQRHFDEQKMRLKAFDSSKKVGVSADSMIENILGTKDAPKMRSPQPLKKQPAGDIVSSQGTVTAKQGTPVDWSKMNNINTLFGSIQGASTLPVGSGAGQIAQLPSHGSDTISDASFSGPVMDSAAQMILGRLENCQGGHLRLPSGPLENSGSSVAVTKKADSKSVQLPGWLSDSNSMPAVYQQAGSLVEGKGGWVDTSRAYMLLMKTGLPPPYLGVLWEMVNLTQPGQLLGQEFTALLALVALVQSGQTITNREVLSTLREPILPIIDHPALLPLVQDYLKQKQQQQTQTENSKENVVSGVDPLLNNEQTSSISNDDDFDDFVSGPSQSAAAHLSQCISLTNQQMQSTTGQTHPQARLEMPVVGPSGSGVTSQHSQKPSIPSVDKIKRMNLPKVGFSPELSPSTSFDHTCDDEFDDFQSAAVSSVASLSTRMSHMGQSVFPVAHSHSSQNVTTASSVEPSQGAPMLLQPEKTGQSEDKYAVFRDLEVPSEEECGLNLSEPLPHSAETADESFGDFCSSEPVSLIVSQSSFPPIPTTTSAGPGTNNTSPVSFEVYSTPPEMIPESNVDSYFEADFGGAFAASTQSDNYADIHEAMKRAEIEQKKKEMNDWSDPFGEFEETPSMPISSTSTGSLPVPQLSIGVCDEEDEDFGDFMGPDTGGVESIGVSCTHSFPSLAENLGETQSVASLELPGLEMTVGLQTSETRGSGSNQSPDLFMQPRGDIGAVEDHLRSLSLESSTVFGETSESGVLTSGGIGGVQPTGTSSVMDTFGSGLVDKYSIIREEANKVWNIIFVIVYCTYRSGIHMNI